jgi:hypothetical protein
VASWKDHLMEQSEREMEEGYTRRKSSYSSGQWVSGQWKSQYELDAEREQEKKRQEYDKKANYEFDGRFTVGKLVKQVKGFHLKDYGNGIIKSISKNRDCLEVQWLSSNKVMKVNFNSEIKLEVLYTPREYQLGVPETEKYSIYAKEEYDYSADVDPFDEY